MKHLEHSQLNWHALTHEVSGLGSLFTSMPSSPSDERLEQAILKSVKDGLYPEEEAVLSAELPSSALGSLEELLQNARKEVEVGRKDCQFNATRN